MEETNNKKRIRGLVKDEHSPTDRASGEVRGGGWGGNSAEATHKVYYAQAVRSVARPSRKRDGKRTRWATPHCSAGHYRMLSKGDRTELEKILACCRRSSPDCLTDKEVTTDSHSGGHLRGRADRTGGAMS